TARLLAGVVAGLGISATFTGDDSLVRRPMDRIIEPLRKMGCNIYKDVGALFTIYPSKLVGIDYTLPVASAQVKSCILLAGLFADGETIVREATATRDHTERMLQYYDAEISVSCNKITIKKSVLNARDIYVPNDFSASVYPIVLAIKKGGCVLSNVGVNATRSAALDILISSGANIKVCNRKTVCNEQVADIVVEESALQPLYASVSQSALSIDELPALAILACGIGGESLFEGVGELRYKESDRISTTINLVESFGGEARFVNGNLYIKAGKEVKYLKVAETKRDHRLVMCAVCASLMYGGGIVKDTDAISISNRFFFDEIVLPIKRLALIGGSNCANSLSPLLMTYLARQFNINVSYEIVSCDNLTDEQLKDKILSYDGVNVTMPYKERVSSIFQSRLNSVNTCIIEDNNVETYSTDGSGFISAIANAGINLADKRVLVVGAGGATNAVIDKLIYEAKSLPYCVNRTQSKADSINSRYNLTPSESYYAYLFFVPDCEYTDNFDINNTKFVFDCNYKTLTRLILRAKEQGIAYLNGLSMLFFQGLDSFCMWFHLDRSKIDGKELYNKFVDILIKQQNMKEDNL
ncbi:MAG: hypothetical protein RR086_05450, partial [Clostridia bacterium]